MSIQRARPWAAAIAFTGAVVFAGLSARSTAQAPPTLEGAWTLNKDASDQPQTSQSGTGDQSGRRSGGSGYGRGGGGGFGGGGGRRRGSGGSPSGTTGNAEDAARVRDAVHDLMTAPDHLTITQTESMIVITSQDGRTTRLAADGKKVKDENTGIERKTKWDSGKLVSEISGVGSSKITQTFSIDPEKHQLHVTLQREAGRNQTAMTQNRLYDLDGR